MPKIILLVSLGLAWVALFAALNPAHVESAQPEGAAGPADVTYVVSDTTDAVDTFIGDGTCLSATGKCTLRAAIQEANAQYATNGGNYSINIKTLPLPSAPPLLFALTITGTPEDNAANGDLDIKSNLLIRTSNSQPALISAAAISDRVFHVIQPPAHSISVTFSNIWMANGNNVDHGGGLLVDSAASVTLSSVRVMSNTVVGQNGVGGGIDFTGGTLTLSGAQVRANRVKSSNTGNGSLLGGGIYASGRISMTGSTIISNSISANSPADTVSAYGGGLYMQCCVGTLEMSNSSILGNSINLSGAAQFLIGGGIDAGGKVTITQSTISNNTLNDSGSSASVIEGGGLYLDAQGLLLGATVANNSVLAVNAPAGMYGGGLVFLNHLQVISSTINGNVVRLGGNPAGYGGGISAGGSDYGADLLLDRSIVESNVADDGGGIESGISNTVAVRNSDLFNNLAKNGAGIFNLGVLSVTNSTLTLNFATNSGGGLYNGQTASVDSTTFYANIADVDGVGGGDGGGIFVPNGATQYLHNSLLTGNADDSGSGTPLPDCAGTIISQDYNLIQQAANVAGCNLIGTTGNDKHGTFANVLATTLQDNGGPTPTLLLPAGSAAINGGDPAGCTDENGNPLLTDQRGYPRLGACDIGAYEFARYLFLPIIMR